MSKGNMIIGVCALVVVIFFFLPWAGAEHPQLGSLKFSGLDSATGPKVEAGGQTIPLGEGSGELWLVFVCGILCLGVVVANAMGFLKGKMGSYIAILLAVVGVVMILINMGGDTKAQYGVILTIIAEVGIIAGAGLNLFEKRA